MCATLIFHINNIILKIQLKNIIFQIKSQINLRLLSTRRGHIEVVTLETRNGVK